MQDYLKKYVQHLREKGWLEYAYVFWFDEPWGRDYEFVSQGMATVKKYAPALSRMITCAFNEKLMDGVNLWCPITENLHLPREKTCRERGDGMWWYICSSPRAAPVGEHIEHLGTDMRVWPWQNWGENVTGSGNQAFQCAQVRWRHGSASRRMADESYAPSSMRSLCTYLSTGCSVYAEAGDTIFWCIDYPNSKRSRCANMMV